MSVTVLLRTNVRFQLRSKTWITYKAYNLCFWLELKMDGFRPPKKTGMSLETDFLKVKQMSRPKSVYLDFPNSISNALCGLLFRAVYMVSLTMSASPAQCPGRFSGIIGWDPKCFQVQPVASLHLLVLLDLSGFILEIPLKLWVNFLKSWTSTGSFVTSGRLPRCSCGDLPGQPHTF